MLITSFNNMGKVITTDHTEDDGGCDITITDKDGSNVIKAFSLSKEETNVVLRAFLILNNKKFKNVDEEESNG